MFILITSAFQIALADSLISLKARIVAGNTQALDDTSDHAILIACRFRAFLALPSYFFM
jgi:hypothetical protein